LDRLSRQSTLHETLHRYFEGDATEIKTDAIEDWQGVVRSVFGNWLFEYRDLIAPQAVGSLNCEASQREILDEIMDWISAAIHPTAAWKVDVTTKGFYELLWDDIALETTEYIYFLHLGMSD
jgi:hypothetical protein